MKKTTAKILISAINLLLKESDPRLRVKALMRLKRKIKGYVK